MSTEYKYPIQYQNLTPSHSIPNNKTYNGSLNFSNSIRILNLNGKFTTLEGLYCQLHIAILCVYLLLKGNTIYDMISDNILNTNTKSRQNDVNRFHTKKTTYWNSMVAQIGKNIVEYHITFDDDIE